MSEPKVEIAWIGGNCPVQAEGLIEGKPFYFRARGRRWRVEIGGATPYGDPEWEHSERYTPAIWPDPDEQDKFSAGWMGEIEARRFIIEAAKLYVAQRVTA